MSKHESFHSLTGRWRTTQKRGISISALVTGLVVTVLFVAGATLSVFIAWQNSRSRTTEAYLRARSTAAILAQLYADATQSHGFGHRDLGGVQVILENWFSEGAADKDLAWAYIRDGEGQVVVGHLRAHLLHVPAGLTENEAIRDWFLGDSAAADDEFVKHAVNLERDQDGQRVRYAEVKIGYSLQRIRADFRRQLVWAGLIGLLAVVIMSVGMLGFLRRLVLHPLSALAEAMEDVRRGLFDTRAKVERHDEIGALAETFNFMMVGLAEREQLEDAFQRYVSKQILEKLMESGEQLQLRGETRLVTVLFSDIRGFTTMTEKLLPEQVVSGLNEYFTEMVDVVFRHDGFINKFVGDAMMAVWGAPFDHDQPELRAIRTALEMEDSLRELNKRRTARGDQALQIGIGVATGFAVSGNIGHVERMEYTVIGDAVNVAQRIESQTKKVGHSLLVAESTYRTIADRVEAVELPTMVVKGKEEPLKLFAVKAMRKPPEEQTAPLQAPLEERTAPLGSRVPGEDVALPEPPPSAAMSLQAAAMAVLPDPVLPQSPPVASFEKGPAVPAPDGAVPVSSYHVVPPGEITLPSSEVPEAVRVSEPLVPRAGGPLVAPLLHDEVTVQPRIDQPPVQYLDPTETSRPATPEFQDPVTSKLYEAEFFKQPPKVEDPD